MKWIQATGLTLPQSSECASCLTTIFEFAVLKFKGFMKKISTLIEVKVFVVYNEFGFPHVAVRICT